MLRVTIIFALFVSVFGFSPISPNSARISVQQPLKMAEDPEPMAKSSFNIGGQDSPSSSSDSTPAAKNLMKDAQADYKWKDTELSANTSFDPASLSSVFLLLPLVLLLNDAFHFLPESWNVI